MNTGNRFDNAWSALEDEPVRVENLKMHVTLDVAA